MLSVGRVYLAQVAGQLVLVALVTLALYHFHRHYRRAYLRHWTRSWVALAVYVLTAFASARLARMGLLSPSALAGLGFVSMAAAYLHIVWLLLGTWEIASGRSAPTRAVGLLLALGTAAVALSAVASMTGEAVGRPFLGVGVRSLIAAVAYVMAALWVLRPAGPRPAALGRRLMSLALIGYAASETAYFALTARAGPVPYADLVTVGMFDILAQALTALAIVIWLLEDERAQSLDAIEERRRKDRAQACVYRISDAVHSVRDLQALFRTIHTSIGEVLPARNFYIALFDSSEKTLSFPYFVDEHDTTPSPKPLGRGLTEYVLRTRRPLLATPDVFAALVARGEVELLYTDSVDWIGVPLLVEGEAIGVLAVQTYDREMRLGPEDLDLLVFVSEQVAAAIASRRTAEALRERETLLRIAVEQLPAVLWTADEELRFTSSVGAGLVALGLEPGQVVGTSVAAFVGDDERVVGLHRRALAGESVSFDLDFGGRTFMTRVEPLQDSSSSAVKGVVGIALDVTEEKRAAARLRQVIDLVPHLIFAKDADGRFILANKALAEAHGTTIRDLLGKNAADLGTDPEEARRFAEDDQEVIETGRRKVIPEERFTDASGRVRYLQTIKIPFTFSDSPAMLGVGMDISERKAAEEALRRAAKEESLSILAGGVAHDFNNLLAAVLGHVSLTLAKLPEESPARRHAEKAAATVERAADLTRQMLAYSGRGHFVIQPTDLGALVRDSLPLLEVALPKKVRLETRLDGDTPLVDADVGQIQQVVMNLVINGGEALGEDGGTVSVATGVRDVGPEDERFWSITGQPLTPGRYALLEVRDDGPGMEEETVSRIFDPFFTTKFTGRGLGLAAVLGVIRGHRGGLHVESRRGRGTVFQLLFVPSEGEAAEEGRSDGSGSEARLRLLLIDDEDVVREMVAEVLAHEGVEVIVAPDGERGLELFGGGGDGFDVVLLDLSMPGLSGEETFARLSQRAPHVPVVLSSGYDHAEAMRRFHDEAPVGFIQKPYRPEQLLAEIRRCAPGAGR
jgi:two-component system cell cycle sensor histidine kinase/response regulator CckA